MSVEDYIIREAEDDERSTLVQFLQQHFFPVEHLLTSYFAKNKKKITAVEERIISDDLKRKHEVMVANLPCLVAVYRETQAIVGMNLVMVVENPKLSTDANNDNVTRAIDAVPIRSKLLSEWFSSVLDAADETVDFFEKFPTIKSALKLIIVCVDQNHGGKGLATTLIRESVNWAKGKKIELVCGLFTSPFSQKAAAKIGFQSYMDVNILSLRDSEGNLIYEGDPYIISVMALTL